MPSLGHPACHAEQCSVLGSLPMVKRCAQYSKLLTGFRVKGQALAFSANAPVVGDVGLSLNSHCRKPTVRYTHYSLACKPLSPEPAPIFALLVPLQVLDLCAE